jgi:excisionase family DNA binding protein
MPSAADKLFTTLNEAPLPDRQTWLTAAEAAAYLKVKPRTLLLWVREGKVKAFASSGTGRHVWQFRREDLDAILTRPSVAEPRRIQRGNGNVVEA